MSDTLIYYFTGTGNSLYAARLLAERLGNCAIVPIVKTLNSGAPVSGGRSSLKTASRAGLTAANSV